MYRIQCFVIFAGIAFSYIRGDEIDRVGRRRVVIQVVREMVNQTAADTLNLPANATSIRENIVDTFSCENRTYGYYADVDNECQVFHVCLTSESSRGRNVTYRWSFICPNETLFNQEVLTCTRPRDSIDCEDSPMYYYLNMDIGKVPNDTMKEEEDAKRNMRRKPLKRQNMIMDNVLKEVKKNIGNVEVVDFERIEEVDELLPFVEESVDFEKHLKNMVGSNEDMIKGDKDKVQRAEDTMNYEQKNKEDNERNINVQEVNAGYKTKGNRMENARLSAERTLKDFRRSRGSFRF